MAAITHRMGTTLRAGRMTGIVGMLLRTKTSTDLPILATTDGMEGPTGRVPVRDVRTAPGPIR